MRRGFGGRTDGPDRAVKAPWPETKALADILQEQVAFDFSLKRNLWEGGRSSGDGSGDEVVEDLSSRRWEADPCVRRPSSSTLIWGFDLMRNINRTPPVSIAHIILDDQKAEVGKDLPHPSWRPSWLWVGHTKKSEG